MDTFTLPPEVTADLKKMTDEAKNALTAITEVKASNLETKKNVQEWFDKYEKQNAEHAKNYAAWQKSVEDTKTALAEAEKKASETTKISAEAKKRIEDLELKLATKGNDAAQFDDDPYSIGSAKRARESMTKAEAHPDRQQPLYIACNKYLVSGDLPTGFDRKMGFQTKTLRTDVETGAGYLIPQIMDNEIRKLITEISPVRLFARTRTAPGKTMDLPIRTALPPALYEGEGEAAPTGQSTYGSEQVTLYRQTVTVPATLDMMVSSAFDLEREIASDVGEAFGKGEGINYVKGSGIKCPQGFIKDTRPEVVPTASSGVVDFNDIANLIGKLKRGQNPWLFMNRRTLSLMWQIKSSIGVPIWQPVAGALPASIWNFPYNSDFIDLDDAQNGSNAKPIVFADLRRGYEIFDMIGISVIRDDLTQASQAITKWTFRRYNTGRVILPEAIKIMKIL